MSISVKKLIYDTSRKFNLVDSGRAKDYRVVDMVSFVNDAYEIIIEHLINQKDQNETIRNHLRPLMIENYKITCSDTDDCGVCKAEYPTNFYERINARVEVCCDDCEGVIKKFPITKPQGDDIDEARRNPYRKANFYFEQLPSYEYNQGLRLYHDNKFNIKAVYIDYYKKIKRIEAPTLVSCNENIYKNWDSELIVHDVDFEIDSTYLNRRITDVAVLLMKNASGDYEGFQQKLNEILQIENNKL